METPVSEKKTPGQRKKNVLDWVEELVIAVVIIGVVFTFFFRIITVTGNSMAPNYSDGDRVLVTGAALGVEQGDVVVVVNVLEEPIIKRVIATEGQVVDFDPDTRAVLVDGQPVDETQFGLENGITDLPYSSFEVLEFPQTVPEGCVFVLGDNRSVSEDSRYQRVGMIDTRTFWVRPWCASSPWTASAWPSKEVRGREDAPWKRGHTRRRAREGPGASASPCWNGWR